MSFDLQRLCRIEYGGHRFAVSSVRRRERSSRGDGGRRERHVKSIEASGEINGNSPADVAAQRDALWQALLLDKQPLRVIAMDDQLIEFLDPDTIASEGGDGPLVDDVDFDDTTPTFTTFRIRFTASWRASAGGSTPPAEYEEETIDHAVDADGRDVLTRRGRVVGTNAGAAARARLPQPSAVVVVRHKIEINESDTDARYSIEITPLVVPLPAGVVDGELTETEEFNPLLQSRTRTISGHYVGDGAELAAKNAAGQLLDAPTRQRISLATHRQKRADFTHESRGSLRSDKLVEWRERIRVPLQQQTVRAKTYPGAAPLLIVEPNTLLTVEHSGSCARTGGLHRAPPPLFNTDRLAGGEINYEVDYDSGLHRTNWSYTGTFPAMPGQSLTNPADLFLTMGPH